MIEYRWEQSLSPGNEQASIGARPRPTSRARATIWACAARAVDAMIAAMLRARERADFVAAVRALDRVLMSGMLRRSAVLSSRAMGGALGVHRASGADVAVRLPAGDLVASTEAGAAMILGDPAIAATPPAPSPNPVTIDEVFRRLARRRPDALALADAPNRETFTDGAPRRLTYAEADRMVTAIAGRLRQMGLPTDAIIGIQLPNIVESILAMLGVLRAGMIAASLPLLSRRTEAVAALARIGAKALITCGRVGRSTMANSPCVWPRMCSPSATCAVLATTFPTASCRSTICLPPRSSSRSRR